MAYGLNLMKNPGMGEVRNRYAVSIATYWKGNKFLGKESLRIVSACVENAGRSQMAEGFTNAFGQGRLEAFGLQL